MPPILIRIQYAPQEDRDYGFHAWALASDRYKEGVIREGDGGEEGEGEGGEGRAGEAEEWDLLVGRDSNDEVEEEGDYLEARYCRVH